MAGERERLKQHALSARSKNAAEAVIEKKRLKERCAELIAGLVGKKSTLQALRSSLSKLSSEDTERMEPNHALYKLQCRQPSKV